VNIYIKIGINYINVQGGFMKKYVLGITVIFIFLILSSGCIFKNDREKFLDQIKENGSGNVIKESRDVSGFNVISFGDIFFVTNFIVQQGDKDSILIEAEDNLMPHIITDFKTVNVTEPFLAIGYEADMPKPTKPINFYITVKELNKLSIGGEGDVKVNDINTKNFLISIGMANCSLNNIQADNLDIDLSGAARLYASGNVKNQDVKIFGNSIYQGENLESQQATVVISYGRKGGNATIKVKDILNAEIIGPGQIYYIGNPQVNQKISSEGKLTRIS